MQLFAARRGTPMEVDGEGPHPKDDEDAGQPQHHRYRVLFRQVWSTRCTSAGCRSRTLSRNTSPRPHPRARMGRAELKRILGRIVSGRLKIYTNKNIFYIRSPRVQERGRKSMPKTCPPLGLEVRFVGPALRHGRATKRIANKVSATLAPDPQAPERKEAKLEFWSGVLARGAACPSLCGQMCPERARVEPEKVAPRSMPAPRPHFVASRPKKRATKSVGTVTDALPPRPSASPAASSSLSRMHHMSAMLGSMSALLAPEHPEPLLHISEWASAGQARQASA